MKLVVIEYLIDFKFKYSNLFIFVFIISTFVPTIGTTVFKYTIVPLPLFNVAFASSEPNIGYANDYNLDLSTYV